MMTDIRLSVVLWLAVVVSAFAVIASSHGARKAFMQWQSMLKQAQAYEVEWGQLLIEKNTQASYARLEALSKEKLKMTVPQTKQIVIVRVGQ